MPVTRITVSTAMRARDVSRPRDEHDAEAEARELRAGREKPGPAAQPSGESRPPASATPAGAPVPPAGIPVLPVRRRRRRGR